MNKKILLTTSLVAIALATSSLYSVSYASNSQDDESDDSAMHDMNDDRGGLRADRKDMMKEKKEKKEKKEMHKEMMGDRKEMHEDFFKQLDSSTRDAIEALHEEYDPLFEAIKHDTTKTNEEKKAAGEVLHSELHAKVRALIPTDLLEEFDTMKEDMDEHKEAWKMKKDDMKEEWKNTKEERKAKRQERRATMKARHRVVFSKVDNVLTKFESNKTTEQMISTYTNIITKLDEKLDGLDPTSDIAVFLENLKGDIQDRIGELEASA